MVSEWPLPSKTCSSVSEDPCWYLPKASWVTLSGTTWSSVPEVSSSGLVRRGVCRLWQAGAGRRSDAVPIDTRSHDYHRASSRWRPSPLSCIRRAGAAFSFVNAFGLPMDCPSPVVPPGPPSAAHDPTPTQWRPWRWPLPQSLPLGIPLGAPIVRCRPFRRARPVFAPPGQFGWLHRIIVGYLGQDRTYSGLSQRPPVVTACFG
jgi:hypothetical protein